jgi:hypothetical protein
MYLRNAVLDHRKHNMIEKIGTLARYITMAALDQIE